MCATPLDTSADYNDRPSPLLLLTMVMVGVFAFLQMYSVQSILPELQRDLHASVVELGSAVGAPVLAVALVSPLMGMASDALGRKALIVIAVLLMALPTAALMGVDTVQQFTLWRFMQGLTVPGVTVVTLAYIGEEFRGAVMLRVMALYVAGSVLGGFSGRFLLGHLTEWMSWRTAFGVMALFNLIGAVLVWRVLPPSRHFVPHHQFSHALHMLRTLVRLAPLQAACALGFTVLFAQVGMFTFINLHLAAAPYHFSPADLANLFTIYLVGVVVTPLAGRWVARLGARRTVLLSVGLSALGVALTLSSPVWAVVLALTLASCSTFVTQSSTVSFIAYHIDEGRSLASGLYYSGYYAGGFCGAWLGGLAYAHGGWAATVALLVLTQALGWMVAWRFMRAHRRE